MQEENILMQAGLSEEQSLAYQALLEKGPQKASDLARWTGIKRGLIYKVLEQLENMGLVSEKGGPGTVAVFSPAHPSILLSNIERKEKEVALTKEMLVNSIGAFSSKFNLITGKPNVQFFEGKEGILKIAQDSLSSKTDICSFVDTDTLLEIYPELNKEYVNKRLKNNVKKKIISTDSPKVREAVKEDDKNLTEQRVVKKNIHEDTIVMIYDNKVSFITLDQNKNIGVLIEDADIYKTHQAIFDYIWETAEIV
ncbi:MAG TPA: helix-turn-helix domain-containing protein [Candidatus Paceibacterota bacterium]|nr:helix-turn-helix domain-containing protein [Candidatus Paceibacterota bacterium]